MGDWLLSIARWLEVHVIGLPLYFALPAMIIIGALEYPRWKFLLTVMIARSVRYYVEGILAVFYGRRVLLFLRDNGLVIVSIVATLALIALGVYIVVKRRRGPAAADIDSEGKIE